MKKAVCLFLALVMAMLSLASALAQEVSRDAFPIVEAPITLTGFATAGPYTKGEFNDLEIWRIMEAMTNVYIDFESAPSAQAAEKRGLLFATNNLPDIIFKTPINNADVMNYAMEGQIQPIDHLLDEYAPNFSVWLEAQPEIRKAITMADGRIYGFPYLVLASPSTVSPKLFYNKLWHEQSGFAPAATLDDLAEQLRAFKDSDWNGNGQADEIPLAFDSALGLFTSFYGAFGLGTRGVSSGGTIAASGASVGTGWDIDPVTGELRCIWTAEGYRDMLAYLSGLYTEGLIDPEVFTTTLADFQAKGDQNLIGFGFCHNNNYFGAHNADYIGLPAPLTAGGGDMFYAAVTLPISGANTFITSACETPEAVVRYIDYFYSEEGITLYFMGIEGVTYEYGEDGNPYFTEYVRNNEDGMNMEEVLGTYVCWSGGGNPSVADDIHFGVHLIPEATVTAAQNLKQYGPEIIWPQMFAYTDEETERLNDLRLDIETYVMEMRAKFVTGSESLDAWDTYVATMERMGIAELREIVQAGLDRFNALE